MVMVMVRLRDRVMVTCRVRDRVGGLQFVFGLGRSVMYRMKY